MYINLPVVGKVKKPKVWVIGLVSAVVLIGAVGARSWVSQASDKPTLEDLTVKVESKDITLRITASGTITPAKSVNLSPKQAGVLAKLLVEQGDEVEKGQVIARMDTRDLEGQLIQANAAVAQAKARLSELQAGNRAEEIQQARARLLRAEAELARIAGGNQLETIAQVQSQVESAKARLKLALTRLNSFEQLYKAGAETRDRRDEAQAEADTARANLVEVQRRLQILRRGSQPAEVLRAKADVAEARQAYELMKKGSRPEAILQAKAAVAEAQGRQRVVMTQVSDTIIRAPFAGIITQKFATEGAFVTPTTSASSTTSATSTSIVALAQKLEVLATVPEIDIGQVRPGQAVEIRADAFPDQVFKGQVRLVSPEAIEEQNVTSFQVRVKITSGQDKLRSGMNTDLTFLGDTVADSMVLPTGLISTLKGQKGVYIPDDEGKPKFQPVTTGSSIKNQTQILDGVTPGQRVFEKFPEGQEPKELQGEE
ncbi:efflux RND transporter periplasmic adaptor subunit [Acaryochloris sp. IP29b_bin.137]|uniref:efflux RND transporter periplasmic adaptor subunit n=1 Tax=Acaryochloris sp. IP29b_bin.137 TaxID=2969217 RepID=UPI00261F3B80|nr:efflux RND transporter periplasmic adaptor subunit [Acaryochloris sp. IP29b_bin.137]